MPFESYPGMTFHAGDTPFYVAGSCLPLCALSGWRGKVVGGDGNDGHYLASA